METLLELYRNPAELIAWGGYTALAVIIFSETGLLVGFFLPGDSLLVTAGLIAATQPDVLDILALNALLMPMAIGGDACGYWIGYRSGKRIYDRPDSRFFKRKHLIATQAFYEKHGGKTIIIARFMPFARTFAPVVAGVARMGYPRFATFNVIGGIGWIGSMTMTGYLLGNIPNADKYVHVIIAAVIFLSISPGIYAFVRAKLAARRSQPAA
ncbi:MAG: VTT domain-containing protein [Deltaproteobacteria bacterium]|nr:VTT domain-containing protein [Deltaproteobacteria bacterium]